MMRLLQWGLDSLPEVLQVIRARLQGSDPGRLVPALRFFTAEWATQRLY